MIWLDVARTYWRTFVAVRLIINLLLNKKLYAIVIWKVMEDLDDVGADAFPTLEFGRNENERPYLLEGH